MPNSMIQARYRALITSMVAQSKVVKSVSHTGVAGSLRESFVRTIVEPLLPVGGAATTGLIVDSYAGQSGQVDVIDYSRSLMPPLYEDEPSVIPVESAIYAIEVKTTLTNTEVKSALGGAAILNALDPLSINARPTPVLFAFDSDLSGSGKSELNRLVDSSPSPNGPPDVRVIVVVGRGYWYYDESTAQWMHSPPSSDFAEVVDFLGSFVNTVQARPLERLRLYWGNYVVRPDAITPVKRT